MIALLIYSAIYLALFSCTDWLYHRLKVPGEMTRKIVHCSTGFIALTFPHYLEHLWQVGVLCGSFLGLLYLSERQGWFPSITAVGRRSCGSWLFALAVLLCFFTYDRYGLLYYYLPLLVLTVADPVAALVGQRFHFFPIRVLGYRKTIGGALAFLTVTVGTLAIYHFAYQPIGTYSAMLAIALVATVAELLSGRGWDNLTIPLSVITVLYLHQAPLA